MKTHRNLLLASLALGVAIAGCAPSGESMPARPAVDANGVEKRDDATVVHREENGDK